MIGVGVSPGIGMGKILVLIEPEIKIDNRTISEEEAAAEIVRLNEALALATQQLRRIYDKALVSMEKETAAIIEAHMMIIEDPVLIEEFKNGIAKERKKAEYAVAKTINDQVAIFEQIEDAYLRERAADVRDIGNRILKNLANIADIDISNLEEEVILLGRDITPSQMAVVNGRFVKGIICEIGGKTCHTAILARNMEIPAVLGVKDALERLKPGHMVAVDGTKGHIETNLTPDKEQRLREKLARQEAWKKELQLLKDTKTLTKDGRHVELCANIMKPEDAKAALDNGAEGVGLYRTEFLFMDRSSLPCEEEQFTAYKKAVEKMEGRPVIIRTLDIGGDKEIPYLNLPKEENPFLGWRAVRICLENKELFQTQLKAILRASAYGKTKIMFPMIASVEEVVAAKKAVEEAKAELRCIGEPYDEGVEVGIMVEIPSAALAADLIVDEIDFFSIGTNDLTQYTLAVDRINEKVSSLYNSYNPAVLRLIKNVIDVSHGAGKYTGMCGELAGDPTAALLLLGMGLDEFSMNPSAILKIRRIINSVDMTFAQQVAEKVMQLKNPVEIEDYLKTVTSEFLKQ